MTDKQFYLIYTEALASADRDAFVSDWSLSTTFGDTFDVDDDAIISRTEEIGKIWDAAHMSVQDLCDRAGIGQIELSRKFCIPLRTVQNWFGGQNRCPQYVVLMMSRLLSES